MLAYLDHFVECMPVISKRFLDKYEINKRLVVCFFVSYLLIVSITTKEGYKFFLIFPFVRTVTCLNSDVAGDEAMNLLCFWLMFAFIQLTEACCRPLLEYFPRYFWLRFFLFFYLINGIDTLHFAYRNLFKHLAVNRNILNNKNN